MNDRALPPEACLDLQIHLDRVERAGRRCREGLLGLASGKLSPEAYARLLEQHRRAQGEWERKHGKYLLPHPGPR